MKIVNKLTNIILTTQQQLNTRYIYTHTHTHTHTHTCQILIWSLIREDTDDQNIKLSKQAHLEPIIKDPAEFIKLSVSLKEISENLDNKEQSIFRNKYVMYPLGSSTIIIILASGIGLSIWYIRNMVYKK